MQGYTGRKRSNPPLLLCTHYKSKLHIAMQIQSSFLVSPIGSWEAGWLASMLYRLHSMLNGRLRGPVALGEL